MLLVGTYEISVLVPISLILFQCSFFEYKTIKIVYRRYASLFFIMGIDNGEVRVSSIV